MDKNVATLLVKNLLEFGQVRACEKTHEEVACVL